jgi:tetratricopeptide (TPR) repeat protein
MTPTLLRSAGAPLVALALLAASCRARPAATPDVPSQDEVELRAARERYERDPSDEDAIVWLGRRLGYVGRYEEAVAVFSRGLELHPESAWLLRFRGHRHITLRRFEDAVRDLERADALAARAPDEVEPDGHPNEAGIPIGTLRSNIDYHLGLAHYLRGDHEAALAAYERGAERARANPDREVSHAYWTWLTLRHLGRDREARELLAALALDRPLLENHGYQDLLRHFRGELAEDELLRGCEPGTVEHATRAYGAAMRRHFESDRAGGRARLEALAASGPPAAFGCIAAEAQLLAER